MFANVCQLLCILHQKLVTIVCLFVLSVVVVFSSSEPLKPQYHYTSYLTDLPTFPKKKCSRELV